MCPVGQDMEEDLLINYKCYSFFIAKRIHLQAFHTHKSCFCILLVIKISLLGINQFVYVWNELCSTQINIIFQCKTIYGFCF